MLVSITVKGLVVPARARACHACWHSPVTVREPPLAKTRKPPPSAAVVGVRGIARPVAKFNATVGETRMSCAPGLWKVMALRWGLAGATGVLETLVMALKAYTFPPDAPALAPGEPGLVWIMPIRA